MHLYLNNAATSLHCSHHVQFRPLLVDDRVRVHLGVGQALEVVSGLRGGLREVRAMDVSHLSEVGHGVQGSMGSMCTRKK